MLVVKEIGCNRFLDVVQGEEMGEGFLTSNTAAFFPRPTLQSR
ncbi:hypothetical protein DMR_09230 [Solidesulfovibrio magneticus RS-1]|uniref:Uncharacterized protein n=1 Tax=Solidesulfovibrio magneticus (strain ATCC 700980 / DSM 13731 / RS-1) TaxID=573370 RepID=C4XK59_SOLM1|nr:hypothetical protein DMR_09230 [Solidesulfovibrio magneticus RS-1]